MATWPTGLITFAAALFAFGLGYGFALVPDQPDVKTAESFDGVKIVYSVLGKGEPALVFIHGGFADRSYWLNQWESFTPTYQVIALDMAGHGESGSDRKEWNIPSFAEDVKAVIEKEGPGLAFASMTWTYSTDEMPEASSPGMLELERKFYLRV